MVLPSYSSRLVPKAFFWEDGGGGLEVLTGAAKGKALCNLGHCKELQQRALARGPVPANSLVATPLNLLRLAEGAGLGRMLGSALGKSEEGRRGGLQSCHSPRAEV